MRVPGAPLLAAFAVSACYDAELTMTFSDSDMVDVLVVTSIGRQLHDLTLGSGDDPCPDGSGELGVDAFVCTAETQVAIADLLAGRGFDTGDGEGMTPERGVSVSQGEGGAYTVTYDLDRMMNGGNREMPSAEDMEMMGGMMRAAVAGHSIVLTIAAPEIVATTGTLSEDGRSATHVMPLVELLDPEAELGVFTTTVDVSGSSSCMLWLFC